MIDRFSLFHAFEALEQEHRSGRNTRLLVPIEIETLKGLAGRWLEEELRRRQHLRNRLILEIEASPALMEKENLVCIVRMRRSGVQVGLCDRSSNLEQVPQWTKLPADYLRLSHAAVESATAEYFSSMVQNWRAKGRQLIVGSVWQTACVSQLANLGVDYLRGQALAATGPRLDYDFPAAS